MRVLIAILSCVGWELNGFDDAVRDTWLRDVTVDAYFFRGVGELKPRNDIIVLDAPDDREGFSHKVQALKRWALRKEYDFVFQCTGDTFVDPRLLLSSGFEGHDYFGHVHTWPGGHETCPWGFLGGGEGYWTSRKACEKIVEAVVDDEAEDRWVGNVLGRAGLAMVDHSGYGRTVTRHGSLELGGKGRYDPKWMYQVYEEQRRRL